MNVEARNQQGKSAKSDRDVATRLRRGLKIPVMAAPMFIASTPDLVVAQCRSGIIGSIPALNARSTAELDNDLTRIEQGLEGCQTPYAVNLVAHKSNDRLEADLELTIKHRVPIVVLALAASAKIVDAIHGYGGIVLNDVINDRQARKCADIGVDGIIAVAAGAGGHTGNVSPFALMAEIREWWRGLLILSGCIATGSAILAAEALGADLAYVGSPFLASTEANTQPEFKQMILDCAAKDVVIANCFTGANASFLLPSVTANGLDPASLLRPDRGAVNISGGGSDRKAWRDIWSAGQGIGAVKRVEPAADFIAWLADDYTRARRAIAAV
jgi:nitronate monooxygenase